MPSVLAVSGSTAAPGSLLSNLAHAVTTTPGKISTITAVVGGAVAAAFALLLGASPMIGIVAGLVAFAGLMAVIWLATLRAFRSIARTADVRFPPPPSS
jgi:hypothetical protein